MEGPPIDADVRARLANLRDGLLDAARARLRFERRELIAIGVLGLLVVCGAGLAYARTRPADAAAMAPVPEQTAAEQANAGPPPGQIVVHVVGAVRRPGVYDFPDGARVIDAIKAAGGFASKAARAAINLARPLVDGEQLVVPRAGESPTGAAAAASGGGAGGDGGSKVNINLASASDFDTLPGIGPVLAERIVAYREQHGPFRSVQDLQKVSGIGPKKFESIEPLVTV